MQTEAVPYWPARLEAWLAQIPSVIAFGQWVEGRSARTQ
jgi:hypothetical protein